MNFTDACALSKKHPGSWIKHGSNGGWTEYSVQFKWADGILHWTAGCTVGGPTTGRKLPQADIPHWYVYSHWACDHAVITKSTPIPKPRVTPEPSILDKPKVKLSVAAKYFKSDADALVFVLLYLDGKLRQDPVSYTHLTLPTN